ncbi:TauD/TfdA family dioxygenase [Glycomyces harbinensis]|uniref:Taurine catabolism dioxygenase TauD, TfdA family n=1 Tax=Glycomyces harbinensis TaxID=58114 RepID=A0A1G7D290_9ACTN|nr:TauD/TfdA family dioxygenase [Glycomyces harbinensis]SDE45688.1 Taurine catabolism dioxygenase TauD, TfdA family [Glycomyces harbinensis]
MNSKSAPVVLTEPVTGPSAWKRADFTSPDDWTVSFSKDQVVELVEAVKSLDRDKKSFGELTAADFPLPTIAPVMKDLVAELEQGRGFAVLRGFPIADLDESQLETAYFGLSTHVGRATPQSRDGALVHHVKDRPTSEQKTGGHRGYMSNEALPLHTDPSDLLTLLCIKDAAEGGMNQLASSMTVHNHLLEHHRELLGLLYKPFAYDRRGTESAGELPYYWNPIFGYFEGRLACRYYRRERAELAPAKSGVPLSPVEIAALDAFDETAALPEHTIELKLRPGDILMVDNNYALHGRTAFADAGTRSRDLLRMSLQPWSPRAFPEGFAAYREGLPVTA